ncbi:MAG TPA: hypothetical protein VNQ53_09935 [Nocardioides sp.]|nr:hypothetical protein [Nocardioides sp.]
MTEEQANNDITDAAPEPAEEQVRTGVERVDTVVDAVSDLGERPVDEHVAVFEEAHDELRRTLDAPSDDAE